MKKNSTDESTIVENTVQWPRHREEVPRQDELAVIRIHKSVHLMNLYRIFRHSAHGELETLTQLVDFISTEESKTAILSTSTYQSGKSRQGQSVCKFCGETRHTPANTSGDRRKLCKAFGRTCSKCQKKNHFASSCRSGRPHQAQPLQY